MSLPDLIEIVPLTKPVQAEITVPGSKSITNRALILAALAKGKTTLQGALWSEDTQVMVECLQKLGFTVNVAPDPDEFCNRTITVQGLGGKIPNAGTVAQPLELFVGNAGTAARFLSALVCLGDGVYRLSGVPRMHERPQASLFEALRELGYSVEAENKNDKLPVIISGNAIFGPRRSCRVSVAESSQFASALLMCAKVGNWEVKVTGENAEESPYVAMTSTLISEFNYFNPDKLNEFQIESDASSASYFLAANEIVPLCSFGGELEVEKILKALDGLCSIKYPTNYDDRRKPFDLRKALIDGNQPKEVLEGFDYMKQSAGRSEIKLRPPIHSYGLNLQIDAQFRHLWPWEPPEQISRRTDLGDSIMTAIVLTPLGKKSIRFVDLGSLRLQECERVVALRTELTKCGAKVIEEGDTLTVYPSQLHGAEIETYNDHRMAMCFAILGLKVPGIKIKNPACVKKTFPNFFQKLAATPPAGLGATILDAQTQRPLTETELFAN